MRKLQVSACAWRLPIFALTILSAGSAQLTAQTVAPTLTPATLNFTAQAGTSPPTQTLMVATTGAAFNYMATAISSGNWLSVSPNSGATPGSLTVTVNAGALAAGVYGGFVTVQNGTTSSTSVPVTLTLTGTGLSMLTAAPMSFTYDFPSGANTPQSRDLVLVSSATSGSTLGLTTTTSSPMLNVNVTPISPTISSNTPATVAVSINPTGLATGQYYAALAFNGTGMGGTVVFLTVNVGGGAGAALSANPSTLSLAGQAGSTTAIGQNLQITSATSTPVSFSATTSTTSCGSAWLSVNPISGTTPTTVSVQANPAALPAGICLGSITLQSSGSPAVTIPVQLTLSTGSNISLPLGRPSFNYAKGGAVPASQTLLIGSTGSSLNLSTNVTANSGTPVFLTVSPLTAATPATLQLSILDSVLAGLTEGVYTNTVNLTAAGAPNSPQSFPVTLTVTGGGSSSAFLSALPGTAAFQFQVGQATPTAQTIQISSSGAPLQYTVASETTTCPGFFTATPDGGSTADFDSQGQLQSGRITITPVTTALTTPTNCTGTVIVSIAGNAGMAPIHIPVSLNVGTANVLSVSPVAIDEVAVAGIPTPNTQTLTVTSTTATSSINFTTSVATTPPGQSWLSVTPTSSQTPANLTVNLNQSGLLPGVYRGTISIHTGGTTVAQTIPVRFTVVGTMLMPSSRALSFTQSPGGVAPAPQLLMLGLLPVGTTVSAVATTTNGSGWLTVNVPAGQSNAIVSVNSTGLTEGLYRGVVTITVPGAAPNPLNIPVSFVFGTPSALAATPTALTFNYTSGSAVPPPQSLQVTTVGASIPFSAAVAGTSGGNFFSVSPTIGMTPATLTVTLNQAVISMLAAGTYAGSITLRSTEGSGSQTIPVNLTVTAGVGPPTPVITSVVNLATNQAGMLAPGTIIGIFGTNLGPASPLSLQVGSDGKLLTTLADTTVTIDGVAAPLFLVSSGQINAIVPYEVAGKTSVNVIVRRSSGGATASSLPLALNIGATAPGVFALNGMGTGAGAILNQNGSVNGPSNPAANGSIVAVFGTGEGLLNPAVATGSITPATGTVFPLPTAAISATVGGQAATVLYAGSAPGFIAGFLQVNLRLPSALPAGTHAVVLNIGGATSATGVTIVTQ